MAIILKKEEAKEQIEKHPKDTIQFIYDESSTCFHITMFDEEKKVSFYGMLLEEEGLEVLLDYCLRKKYFSLKPFLDTIQIDQNGHLIGYIRYTGEGNIIKDTKGIVEKFLTQMLELLERKAGSVKVYYEERDKNRLTIETPDKKNFTIEEMKEHKIKLEYLIKEYAKRNPDSKVNEDEHGYYFDHVAFQKKGLSQEEKRNFQNTLLASQMEGYLEGMSSSLLFQIAQEINKNQSLERRRKQQ